MLRICVSTLDRGKKGLQKEFPEVQKYESKKPWFLTLKL